MSNTNGNTGLAGSKTKSSLTYPIQPNQAIHDLRTMPGSVTLKNVSEDKQYARHTKQLCDDRIASLNDLENLNFPNNLLGMIIDATEYCACYEVDAKAQESRSLDGERVFQPYLYLFSVLIAFEWQPSARVLQQVRFAMQKASNFLYDVTDGFMAIGQVILRGRGLLDIADIQVMASNRFHPRSWISALHEPRKYQPIRIGRGLWRKDQGFVLPWNESDAHRVLVHEWGHYALELVDEYLDLVRIHRTDSDKRYWRGSLTETISTEQSSNNLDIVVPSLAPPIDSIMSTLASSELIPRHELQSSKRRDYMLGKMRNHFSQVDPLQGLEGPAELPLPNLPLFLQQHGLGTNAEEARLESADLQQLLASLTSKDMPRLAGNSWTYVLKPDGRIVGQGVIGQRDLREGFDLLGAAENDEVVVIAQTTNPDPDKLAFRVQVKRAQIGAGGRIGPWSDATPAELPDFVDVLPLRDAGQEQLPTTLRVQLETKSGALPSQVYIAALGETPKPLVESSRADLAYPDGTPRTRWVSREETFFHLDGHVLLRWDDKIYICGYSHGGGPCTGGGGRCVCYTAGSYEGNSMVFYRDNYDASDIGADARLPELEPMHDDDNITRIVATVMHNGPQYLRRHGDDIAEARSYIFSLGSNHALGELPATLVLYYDFGARKRDGDLLVYRWDGGEGWKQLTTYAPEDQSYLCIPLGQLTSETSGGTNGRSDEFFDRYRIYWTPR